MLRIAAGDAHVYMQLSASGVSTLDASNELLQTHEQCRAYFASSQLCTGVLYYIFVGISKFCKECLSKCIRILELKK